MTKKQRQRSTGPEVLYPVGRGHKLEALTGAWSLATVPGSVLYRLVSRRLRDAGLGKRGRRWEGVTVISVGNIEVGGSGKTPFSVFLLEALLERGDRPVYISRGFKSEAETKRPITIVAPDGTSGWPASRADIRWLTREHGALSRAIGDEGAMVAAGCPSAALLFSSDKRAAVDLAVQLFQPSHVVLDDAFQSWRVHRDVDIVLVDARRPFGNGRLFPAGTLRETPDALARADVIGVNGFATTDDLAAFAQRVRGLTGRSVPVFGLARKGRIVDPTDVTKRGKARVKAPRRITRPVASLSSIARPQAFDDGLSDCGIDLALSIRYPDHHRYTDEDLRHIGRALGRCGCASVVTTEKDWAKLRERPLPFPNVYVSRLELSVDRGDIMSYIEKPQAAPAAFA